MHTALTPTPNLLGLVAGTVVWLGMKHLLSNARPGIEPSRSASAQRTAAQCIAMRYRYAE